MSADLSSLLDDLQPFAQALIDLAGRAGVQPRVTSTLRSRSQQQRLYAAYLRGESHYPVAPPGTSAHEFGYAFDMLAATPEDLQDLGTVWRQWGGLWSPTDEVHFEYPGFVRPPLPKDLPAANAVQQAAQSYVELPWWATILAPVSVTAASGRIQDVSKGSLGARTLCYFGAKEFC